MEAAAGGPSLSKDTPPRREDTGDGGTATGWRMEGGRLMSSAADPASLIPVLLIILPGNNKDDAVDAAPAERVVPSEKEYMAE